MGRYKTKLQTIQEANKRILKEESDDESREKRWKDNRFYGFSDKTLIGAMKYMMKIPPYDLDRI